MVNYPKYFIYRTFIYTSGGGLRVAKLVSKMPAVKDPMQKEPYDVNFELTYQINPRFEPPDNYADSHGFSLFSKRLIDIIDKYEVEYEKFPIKVVDKNGKELNNLKYWVFHLLEEYQDGLNEKASGYNENELSRIKKLVLNYSKFDHKPLFYLKKVYFPMIREDLKNDLEENKISGFTFVSADDYNPYHFNFAPGQKLA